MLLDMQQRFLRALLFPGAHSSNTNSSLDAFPAEPLKIYHQNYTKTLSLALGEVYPISKKIVGAKFFQFIALQYIENNHSISYSLNNYGAGFADFVKDLPSTAHLAYLPDVIRLEYLINQSILGKDAKGFQFNEFNKVPLEMHGELKFQLLANSYLLESQFPVDEIWQFNQDLNQEYYQKTDTSAFSVSETELETKTAIKTKILTINRAQTFLFIYYIDAKLHIDRISSDEYLFLQELKNGKKFQDVCENLLNQNVAGTTIAKILPKFLQRSYIDSFSCL